jgi:hypothetical protein
MIGQWIAVLPLYDMSDLNHQLLGELAEAYRDDVRQPEPFEYTGVVERDGDCRQYTIKVDLYNWSFRVKGIGTAEYRNPREVPKTVVAEADVIGSQLLQQILGYDIGVPAYFVLRSEPGGIRC